jgi:hypothetical protein
MAVRPFDRGGAAMLRRNVGYGSICAVLIAASGATVANAQNNANSSGAAGMILAAPDPCAAPADLPAPTSAGPVDAEGRPVVSADIPAANALGDVPIAIVKDLGAQAAAGGGKPDPRFDAYGYPATLTVQGNRVMMNGWPIASDQAEADAARLAACAKAGRPVR